MFDAEKMQRLADARSSVADKIRALDRAGLSRAEIARFLDKRYQHVRNVLEADKQRARSTASCPEPVGADETRASEAGAPVAEPASLSFLRLVPQADGSVVLPRHILDAIGAARGEVLVGIARPGELVLRTPAASVSHAQELVRALIPGGDSLAESLIADRRREVEGERISG
jgi:hypothetical protein